VYTTGLMLSAARSFRVPTQRVGTRKTASGITFYNTLPRRARQAMDGRIPPGSCQGGKGGPRRVGCAHQLTRFR